MIRPQGTGAPPTPNAMNQNKTTVQHAAQHRPIQYWCSYCKSEHSKLPHSPVPGGPWISTRGVPSRPALNASICQARRMQHGEGAWLLGLWRMAQVASSFMPQLPYLAPPLPSSLSHAFVTCHCKPPGTSAQHPHPSMTVPSPSFHLLDSNTQRPHSTI